MCLFKRRTIFSDEKKELSQEETDALLKDIDGEEEDDFPFGISATKEQNFLDCVVDDDGDDDGDGIFC